MIAPIPGFLRGHPYDETNTRRRPDGRRWCYACHQERRAIKAAKKAAS